MTTLVTGGAGFIGSHLVDRLINEGKSVRVIDNLSSGKMENLKQWQNHPGFEFIQGDLLNINVVRKSLKGCNEVYHMAANPEVNIKKASPEDHFRQNIEATYNLLETIREYGKVKQIVFASTSTVYGEANQIPTTEKYGPLVPISLYGASKLACEGLLSAYASMFDFQAISYRLANVVGERSDHGVIFDFVNKLRKNPNELEVLGDGKQSKSYLYVDDCIEGFMKGKKVNEPYTVYNIGSEDRTDVITIAEIIKEEMGLTDAEIRLTGGVDGGRGWKGDVKIMQLSMDELKSTGWIPRHTSAQAVRLTAKALIKSKQ